MAPALAPAWTQETYAEAMTNSALHDLERKLAMMVPARRSERWDQQQMLALQRHVLAVALSELTAAERRRGRPHDGLQRVIITRWPR